MITFWMRKLFHLMMIPIIVMAAKPGMIWHRTLKSIGWCRINCANFGVLAVMSYASICNMCDRAECQRFYPHRCQGYRIGFIDFSYWSISIETGFLSVMSCLQSVLMQNMHKHLYVTGEWEQLKFQVSKCFKKTPKILKNIS